MKPILRLVLVLLLAASCEQPTVDPDQKLRDTIVGRAWTTDPAFATTDAVTPKMVFYVDGSVVIDSHRGTWSYVNSVFTIVDPRGDRYKTTSPAFSSSHFTFFYGPDTTTPQLVHLIR